MYTERKSEKIEIHCLNMMYTNMSLYNLYIIKKFNKWISLSE